MEAQYTAEHCGHVCTAAGGLGGRENGQIPQNSRPRYRVSHKLSSIFTSLGISKLDTMYGICSMLGNSGFVEPRLVRLK